MRGKNLQLISTSSDGSGVDGGGERTEPGESKEGLHWAELDW